MSGDSNRSWDANAKYVLNKLHKLEENQEASREKAEEHHQEMSNKIDDLREYFDTAIRREREEITGKIDQQDVTDQVAELQTHQKIIGGALLILFAAIMYLHFGFTLP